jgi:NlpC/P60 family putative phage cell wall peptidase
LPIPTARTEIVALARECLGTPFRHQGRLPGVGMDCVGIVIYVWNAIGLPAYEKADYGRNPNPSRMGSEIGKMLKRISIHQAGPGDIVYMAWGKFPQHLAILTEIGIIHSYQTAGKVVEHPLDAFWRARIHSAYRFPCVE